MVIQNKQNFKFTFDHYQFVRKSMNSIRNFNTEVTTEPRKYTQC